MVLPITRRTRHASEHNGMIIYLYNATCQLCGATASFSVTRYRSGFRVTSCAFRGTDYKKDYF